MIYCKIVTVINESIHFKNNSKKCQETCVINCSPEIFATILNSSVEKFDFQDFNEFRMKTRLRSKVFKFYSLRRGILMNKLNILELLFFLKFLV